MNLKPLKDSKCGLHELPRRISTKWLRGLPDKDLNRLIYELGDLIPQRGERRLTRPERTIANQLQRAEEERYRRYHEAI